jgi:hypothetical protein
MQRLETDVQLRYPTLNDYYTIYNRKVDLHFLCLCQEKKPFQRAYVCVKLIIIFDWYVSVKNCQKILS